MVTLRSKSGKLYNLVDSTYPVDITKLHKRLENLISKAIGKKSKRGVGGHPIWLIDDNEIAMKAARDAFNKVLSDIPGEARIKYEPNLIALYSDGTSLSVALYQTNHLALL